MDLLTKLKQIDKTATLDFLPTDTAKDLDELWVKLIEPRLPKESAVRGWHKLLMDYIKRPNAVFTLRTYASPSGNSPMLRRGFYNTTDHDFSAFYIDNSFTAYFCSMAIDGYVPTLTEFVEAINSRKFPSGYFQSPEERIFATHLKGKPCISTRGYKIAHIFSAGEDFNLPAPYNTIGTFCDHFFPRAVNTDWSATATDQHGTYNYRKVSIAAEEVAQVRAFLVAHFLRTVHPINYFLVPKKPNRHDKATGILKTFIYWHNGVKECDEIGEYAPLIEYVAAKIKDKYDDIYDEFISYIYPNFNANAVAGNKQIDATYGIDIWRTKIGTAPSAPPPAKPAKKRSFKKGKTGGSGIGKEARRIFTELLNSGRLTPMQIDNLMDKSYCKANFNMNYPILADALKPYDGGRYYRPPVGPYVITNDWYSWNRGPLEIWLATNGFII